MVDNTIYKKCSTDITEDVPKRYGYGIRHVQMACMFVCMTALFIARGSFGVAILAMTDSSRRNNTTIEIFDWDKRTQGIILSSFFWGYTLMQIPAGLLAKKYGGKPILLVALLANGAITLIMPVMAGLGGWTCVCACRMVMGLTQACLFPASQTLLGRWLPASEMTALSGIVYGGYQIGTIIAMPISGMLAETVLGWKMIFYCISGLMFLTAGVWSALAASSPAEHRLIGAEERKYIEAALNSTPANVDRPIPWKHIFRSVPVYAILAAQIASVIAFILFFVDLPTYLERAMGLSLKSTTTGPIIMHIPITAGFAPGVSMETYKFISIPWKLVFGSAVLSGMPYAGMWIGSLLATKICQMIFNRGILSLVACRKIFNSIALNGAACGLVALAFLDTDRQYLAVCMIVGTLTLLGFMASGFMVNHLDLSPQFAGVMCSLTNFFASFCSILTPITTSFILKNDPSDVSRWRIVFLLVAVILVSCNIVYVALGGAERQPWDSPDHDDSFKGQLEEINPVSTKNHEKEQEANNLIAH